MAKKMKKTVKKTKRTFIGEQMISYPFERHADERGALAVIFSEKLTGVRAGSVAIITSKAGTERANHRHKKDAHFVYVVSGRMIYAERVGDVVQFFGIGPGEIVFTPPKVDHAMKFLEDTVLVVVGDRSRTMLDYEQDLIRVPSLFAESL